MLDFVITEKLFERLFVDRLTADQVDVGLGDDLELWLRFDFGHDSPFSGSS